ncbi:MAG: HEAT repeat domain-containing protein [Acidimicrobiia bacterium]
MSRPFGPAHDPAVPAGGAHDRSDPAGEPDSVARAVATVSLGHRPGRARAEAAHLEALATGDSDVRVRVAALGALARTGGRVRLRRAWEHAARDPAAPVRRRAAELAVVRPEAVRWPTVVALVDDAAATVVEAAAWALGEQRVRAVRAGAVAALAGATRHADPLVREAAVAALGALGHRDGLAAVLDACNDVPAVRRRAVLALAPFDGPAVERALHRARADRDSLVRQAAEDLTHP